MYPQEAHLQKHKAGQLMFIICQQNKQQSNHDFKNIYVHGWYNLQQQYSFQNVIMSIYKNGVQNTPISLDSFKQTGLFHKLYYIKINIY
jgi:hypothetical protein